MKTLVAVLLALVICAPTAAARSGISSSPPSPLYLTVSNPQTTALANAQRYWQSAVPCAGSYTFAVAPVQNLTPGVGEAIGQSSWHPSDEDPTNPLLFTDCSIRLSPVAFPADLVGAELWPAYCVAVVHEYGHLLGHPHSTDPSDPMYPLADQLTDQAARAGCTRSRRGRTPRKEGRSRREHKPGFATRPNAYTTAGNRTVRAS